MAFEARASLGELPAEHAVLKSTPSVCTVHKPSPLLETTRAYAVTRLALQGQTRRTLGSVFRSTVWDLRYPDSKKKLDAHGYKVGRSRMLVSRDRRTHRGGAGSTTASHRRSEGFARQTMRSTFAERKDANASQLSHPHPAP